MFKIGDIVKLYPARQSVYSSQWHGELEVTNVGDKMIFVKTAGGSQASFLDGELFCVRHATEIDAHRSGQTESGEFYIVADGEYFDLSDMRFDTEARALAYMNDHADEFSNDSTWVIMKIVRKVQSKRSFA